MQIHSKRFGCTVGRHQFNVLSAEKQVHCSRSNACVTLACIYFYCKPSRIEVGVKPCRLTAQAVNRRAKYVRSLHLHNGQPTPCDRSSTIELWSREADLRKYGTIVWKNKGKCRQQRHESCATFVESRDRFMDFCLLNLASLLAVCKEMRYRINIYIS